MAPPVEVFTTRPTPASRAASSTLIVPTTLTPASQAGSSIDLRTSICAARWKTMSGRAAARALRIRSASRMSASSKPAPRDSATVRFSRLPVARLSMTRTSSPRSSSASTRFEPMKPAPPVTRARMGGGSYVRDRGEPGSLRRPVCMTAISGREIEAHPCALTAHFSRRLMSATTEDRSLGVSHVSGALPDGEAEIELRGVSKRFSARKRETLALTDIELGIRKQEFVTLLGQSGCGKTTLLRILAGLTQPSAGEVTTGAQPLWPGDHRDHDALRKLVLVFQDANLLPWYTVEENIGLPLLL